MAPADATPPEPAPERFEDRHPRLAALAGAIAGFVVWLVVLLALIYGRPLVDLPAADDGKGGFVVEAFWLWFACPACVLLGAWWPNHLGKRFRERRQRA